MKRRGVINSSYEAMFWRKKVVSPSSEKANPFPIARRLISGIKVEFKIVLANFFYTFLPLPHNRMAK
jgi:hypothetical protein